MPTARQHHHAAPPPFSSPAAVPRFYLPGTQEWQDWRDAPETRRAFAEIFANRQVQDGFRANPVKFLNFCWPATLPIDGETVENPYGVKPYSTQIEILESVRDNVNTVVHSAHSAGKTFIAAVTCIHHFLSRTPARVVATSSNEAQVKDVLLKEIRRLVNTAYIPLPIECLEMAFYKLDAKGRRLNEDYIKGMVGAQVESFAGQHLPNDIPRVLVVIEEASACSDEKQASLESIQNVALIIGNPLANTNFFYRWSKQGDLTDPAEPRRLLRKIVHIDGRETPNVLAGLEWRRRGLPGRPPLVIPGVLSFDEYLQREATWDAIKKEQRLYGRFYEGAEMLLFPPAMLDACEDRYDELAAAEKQSHEDYERRAKRGEKVKPPKRRTPEALGVDVAAGGRDDTVFCLVDRLGVLEMIEVNEKDTQRIVDRIIELIKQHKLWPSRICLDAGGGGKQLADHLYRLGFRVTAIHFGAGADDEEGRKAYKNMRVQMYAEIRHLCGRPADDNGPAFGLSRHWHKLRQELAILPLQYDGEGRMWLPPKDPPKKEIGKEEPMNLRKLLGRSPDRADALALAVHALGIRDTTPRMAVEMEAGMAATGAVDGGRLLEGFEERKMDMEDWLRGAGR